MKKYILSLFIFSLVLAPSFSFAVGDTDPNPQASDCVSIVNNLRYRDRDIDKNGEVSTLQDFLQSKGYLNNEPTGYFGLLTFKAVKDFQASNNISPTGYVGQITKAKIVALTCNSIPSGSNPVISGVSGPQTLNANQTGTWTVSAYDQNGGTLSYSVNWGDANYMMNGVSGSQNFQTSQSATFTHSYTQAGTYTPAFTVTSENSIQCFKAPCPTNGGSATTSLSVNVGGAVPVSSIQVISPNGGETLNRGNYFQINWNEVFPVCSGGASCMPAPFYYDIKLAPYHAPCTDRFCPMIAYRMPYTIAQKVFGYSYSWQVGNVIDNNLYNTYSNYVPSGLYTVQICRSDGTVCDSSDSPFTIQ